MYSEAPRVRAAGAAIAIAVGVGVGFAVAIAIAIAIAVAIAVAPRIAGGTSLADPLHAAAPANVAAPPSPHYGLHA